MPRSGESKSGHWVGVLPGTAPDVIESAGSALVCVGSADLDPSLLAAIVDYFVAFDSTTEPDDDRTTMLSAEDLAHGAFVADFANGYLQENSTISPYVESGGLDFVLSPFIAIYWEALPSACPYFLEGANLEWECDGKNVSPSSGDLRVDVESVPCGVGEGSQLRVCDLIVGEILEDDVRGRIVLEEVVSIGLELAWDRDLGLVGSGGHCLSPGGWLSFPYMKENTLEVSAQYSRDQSFCLVPGRPGAIGARRRY